MDSFLASVSPAIGRIAAVARVAPAKGYRSGTQSGLQELIAGAIAAGAVWMGAPAAQSTNVPAPGALGGAAETTGVPVRNRRGELLARISAAVTEASVENWDEYGGLPASSAAADYARRLGRALIAFGPVPRAAVDPDGEVGLRWYRDALHRLAVSVSPEGRIAYAAHLGEDRVHGTEHLRSGAASTLSDLLTRLYADTREPLASPR